jgi:hypothetical protein
MRRFQLFLSLRAQNCHIFLMHSAYDDQTSSSFPQIYYIFSFLPASNMDGHFLFKNTLTGGGVESRVLAREKSLPYVNIHKSDRAVGWAST